MALGHAWIGLPDLTELSDSGYSNLARDYTTGPQVASWSAPYDLLIVHFSVVVMWSGGRLDPAKFGGRAELVDGIEFKISDTQGEPVGAVLPGNVLRRNADFLRWADDLVYMGESSIIPSLMGYAAHYEPYAAWGAPVFLHQGQGVQTELKDDLSSLDELRVHLVTWKLRPTVPS